MQKHVVNYLKANNLTTADIILCESCESVAVDIHHIIFRSHGGSDEANNLVALCRLCHAKAHTFKEFNEILKKNKGQNESC